MSGANPFCSSRPTHEIMIAVGGIVTHLELEGATTAIVEQIKERYGAFEMPPAPRAERQLSLRLRLRPASSPGAFMDETSASRRPLSVAMRAQLLTAERWDFAVQLAAAVAPTTSTSTELERSSPTFRGGGWCVESPFALDAILRVLHASVLPLFGGMLVHACGLGLGDDDATGLVFAGASGAGKTTLARHAATDREVAVLSDEIVVIRRSADGWRVHGTPFWGDFGRGGRSMRSWPLGALAFLSHGPSVGPPAMMERLAPADATRRLLGCFLAFAGDRATATRNLALAGVLCSEVPTVEAALTRDVSMREIRHGLEPILGAHGLDGRQPLPAREMISELRHFLRTREAYALRPMGTSMLPWLRSGDTVFVEAADARTAATGDVVLYWRPGAAPENDALVCHRLVARLPARGAGGTKLLVKGDALPRFEVLACGRDSEILGRVASVMRAGKTLPVPPRATRLAQLGASLLATPLLRVVRR
jgi:hypothetical protein